MVRALYRLLVRLIPKTRFGDNALAWINFVVRHRRLPSNRLLFNDALYRIKTTDEITDPLRVFVSDKELVKLYVRATVGEEYNVPTIAILHSPAEVEGFNFPATCCIKPTQSSGQVILRTNGEPVDRELVKSWFSLNHYDKTRERNYRSLRPKVIVEQLIALNQDYKFHCVNGSVKLVQVDLDRHTNHTRALLDREWNLQDYGLLYPRATEAPDRPANLAEMIAIAERLSAAFSFVRIDMYSDGRTCSVGEITNCHGSAFEPFIPRSAEQEASKLLFT